MKFWDHLKVVILHFLKLLRQSMGDDHTLRKIVWQLEERLRRFWSHSN